MKLISKFPFLIIITLLICCQQFKFEKPQRIKFNENWQFTIADSIDLRNGIKQTKWEVVTLPHTTRIEPKIVNNQWQGICFYKKEFRLPNYKKNQKLLLQFEGAMNIAEVWVNDKKLIKHQGGYLPFTVDFTEVAKFNSKNIVIVKLNNKDNPVTGPKPLKKLDFNTYGGIYRNVWLVSKNKLHITDPILKNKTASGGVFVTYPNVSDSLASINVKTHIRNEFKNKKSFTIRQTLFQNDEIIKKVVGDEKYLSFNQDQQFSQTISINNPNLWSPSYPNLYTLKTEIISTESVIDEQTTTIGIKNVEFKGQELFLNGKKTFLRGVNRHQEYPYIGYALSDNANYRDAKKIKDAGFDYVRLSHYPQSTSFMEACDELGLITIDAILGWQYFSEDKNFHKHVFQTAKDLIRRDRNHASVLAWEVSLNESWMPEYFIDSLTTIAKKEYPTDQCFTAGWQSYGYDIYLQARQHRLQHYDPKIKKPYNVSEYGDWEYYAMNAGLNQDTWGGLLQQERSSRQLRSAGEKALLQQATNIQEAHNDNLNTPAFADGYWVMYDYNRGYANDVEASGIMDLFRIPKPSYYFYQSQRDADNPNGKPMIYIANRWTKESPRDVRIFSNCDEVELFLNGKSLGIQKPDSNRISNNLKHPPFTFRTSFFKEGELIAKGYINNKEVASHTVNTPKQPTQIKIEIDNDYPNGSEDKSDIIFVYAKVLDENGTLISDCNEQIEFKVQGDAEIIGSHKVNAEAGIASILIKTKSLSKDFTIMATSETLNINSSYSTTNNIISSNIPNHYFELKNNSLGNCIVHGDTTKKKVALTFDDGPSEVTKEILILLKKYNVKGTFFWQGKHLNDNKEIIAKAIKEGHTIGNHSWDHPNGFNMTNDYLWNNQVEKTNQAFKSVGIQNIKFYRPPFGAITQKQIDFLASKNIKTVMWSISTEDWDPNQNSEGEMFKKFKENIHNGAIVLLHDYDFGKPEAKLKDLEEIIRYGLSLGYQFVRIEDII